MQNCLIKRQSHHKGFTLIELLAVIAIIGVLAGIVFGVTQGVNNRARISRAETDLMLLAQYLEQYRNHYGDYPRVALADSTSSESTTKREGEDGNVELYNALNGMRGIPQTSSKFSPTDRQRAFIDRSKFNHEFTPSLNPSTPTDPETADVVLIDPWGYAYRYFYQAGASWENPGYVLYSVGPSGKHTPPDVRGYPDMVDDKNTDNIYANRK